MTDYEHEHEREHERIGFWGKAGGEHLHTKRYALPRTDTAEPLAEILSSGRERAATIL